MTTTILGKLKFDPGAIPRLPVARVAVMALLMVFVAFLGEWMRPSYRMSEHKAPITLVVQVPESFGDWRLDRSIIPIEPDPGLQAALDALYSQTLARTYINGRGQRVMLSIAYGSDQSNEATAVHRPEFCYSAQGFKVQNVGNVHIRIGASELPVAQLIAKLGERNEPITYWVTLDETATLPGLGRKLQQIRYGLHGEIPDGMLVRVSSVSQSADESFALQRQFLEAMYAVVPPTVRSRYFGAAKAG